MNPYNLDLSVKNLINHFNKEKNVCLLLYSSYDTYGSKLKKYLEQTEVYQVGDMFLIDIFEHPAVVCYLNITRSPTFLFYNKKSELQVLDIPAAIYRFIDRENNLFIGNLSKTL